MASARSGMALGPIQRLFDEGTLTGLTDAQLVERFFDRRDEGAFAALVARHGPMVLAVCRGVLKDRTNAEDAFQATFIVLFRKAGGLKSSGSLGSWLYRVAYRIAIRANAVAARRRERPIEEVTMAVEAGSPGEAEIDRELLPIIHAEIDRLPDRYRAPIALCCLQGLSYEQAAHQLGLPLGTVGSRITRARELLRSRLVRRGVTATTAALSVLLAREATAAPAGWVEAATRAAMRLGAGEGAAKAAGSVSAAVALSDHVLRRMLMIRLIQMIAPLAVAATAGLVAWASVGVAGRPDGPDAPAVVARRPADPAAGDAEDQPAGQGPIRGRVAGPGWPSGPRCGGLRRPAALLLVHRPGRPDRRRRPIPVHPGRRRTPAAQGGGAASTGRSWMSPRPLPATARPGSGRPAATGAKWSCAWCRTTSRSGVGSWTCRGVLSPALPSRSRRSRIRPPVTSTASSNSDWSVGTGTSADSTPPGTSRRGPTGPGRRSGPGPMAASGSMARGGIDWFSWSSRVQGSVRRACAR